MSLSRLVSTVCVGLAAGVGAAEEPTSAPIVKVVLDDVIHGVSARYVTRALDEAASDDAEIVLIELRTPGGLYDVTRGLIESIFASERPVVVYVAPAGAHAASAGFLLTLAADVAVMAPGTNIGAATPISGTGQEMEETLAKKVRSDAAAYTRSIAERRGRNPQVAELAVTEATAWTAQEALDAKLIDFIAASEEELFRKLDGRLVKRVDGREVRIATAGRRVVTTEMTTKERVLSVVAHPYVAMLLGMIGLAGLYLEFQSPGAVVPGVVGALALLLAAFAFEVLPVSWVGMLLLLVGIGLLVAEALTPSFGALGTGGVVALVLGALMLFEEQAMPTPAFHVSPLFVLPVAVVLAALVGIVGGKVLKAQRVKKPATGIEALFGELATAATSIDGGGKVFIHGEYWDARATRPVPEGARVKVVGAEGLVLDVEPEDS